MCIIVSKEKYKQIPKKSILENCFENNPDGAGFMYTNNGKVIIEKGFLTFDEFYKRLMQVNDTLNLYKKSLVMHFRIGTSGGIKKSTCHPFPVSCEDKDLEATEISCKLGMVHNGIISNYVYGKLSDTQNFVRDLVYPLSKINGNFLTNRYALDLLYEQANETKLCFLDKNDKITYIGKFVEDNGIKYSNETYKYTYTYVTPKNYGKELKRYYDDYYDNYYDDDNDIYGFKKYDKKVDSIDDFGAEYHYIPMNKLKKLENGMVYCDSFDFELLEATDKMYIDENYDLYEIVEEYQTSDYVKAKLIATDIILYNNINEYRELTYNELK